MKTFTTLEDKAMEAAKNYLNNKGEGACKDNRPAKAMEAAKNYLNNKGEGACIEAVKIPIKLTNSGGERLELKASQLLESTKKAVREQLLYILSRGEKEEWQEKGE